MTRRVSHHLRTGLPLAAALAAGLLLAPALVGAQDGTEPINPQGDPEMEAILRGQSATETETPAVDDVTGGSTVEATIDEIADLIALPAQVGRELDEIERDNPNVFATPEGKRLLRENPPFIYVPGTLPDPLIIPWVRDQVIFEEKMEEARKLLVEGKTGRQVPVLRKALEVLASVPAPPDVEAAGALAALRREVAGEVAKLDTKPTGDDVVVTPIANAQVMLPEPVRATTNGVLVDRTNPNESMVVVGDYLLRPGQSVPRFPNVRVKAISKQSVIYEFQGKEFVVNVRSE